MVVSRWTVVVILIIIVSLMGAYVSAASASDVEEARKQLYHPEWIVRRDAALFLGTQGEAARNALTDLTDVMRRDDNDAVRRAAASALTGLGADGTASLIAALTSEDRTLQGIAADALASMGSAARDAVPVLTALLPDAAFDLKTQIISALESIGVADQAVVDQLIAALSDSGIIAWQAWRVLNALTTEAVLGERLGAALQSDSTRLQVTAADYLGRLSDPGETGISALLKALAPTYDPEVRQSAVRTLGALKVNAALADIATLLADDDIDVRQAAARAIGQIGTNDRDVIVRLVMLLSESHELLRITVSRALSTLAGTGDYTMLFDALTRVDDIRIRRQAAEIIARAAVPAHARIQGLLTLINAPEAEVRISAIKALGELGPEVQADASVRTVLADLVEHKDLVSAWHAFLAINRIHQGAHYDIVPASPRRELFAAVETLSGNSSAIVRRLSTQKLLSLADDALVHAIAQAAQDEDAEIALRAVNMLGILATEYPAAYKPLFLALSSADANIAGTARTYFPSEPKEYLDLLISKLTNTDEQIQATAHLLLATQAPGYLEELDNLTTQLEDEFTVERYYDAVSRTWYFLTRVSHRNKHGEIIQLRHAHAIKPDGETVREFAIRTNSVLAFNASTAYITPMNERKATGIQIIDGEIVQEQARNAYTLGIKANNELVAYPPATTAREILDDGAVNALGGFIPLIMNGKPVSTDILNIIANSAEKHPRQVIAQFDNLDILFLSCGGRGFDGEGMTAHDLIRVLSALGVRFAYNLDGGGSTSTVVKGELITQKIDNGGTEERLRPNFLYFK